MSENRHFDVWKNALSSAKVVPVGYKTIRTVTIKRLLIAEHYSVPETSSLFMNL